MDPVKNYLQQVEKLVRDYASVPLANEPDVHNHVLVDSQCHRYLLLSMGWSKGRYIHNVVLHIDIIGQQIWIQANNTDRLIAEELVEAGIPKQAIVLGMQPPEVRAYTGYGIPHRIEQVESLTDNQQEALF